MKLFVITSTRKSDKLTLNIFADTKARAYCLALIYMKRKGYLGSPKIIILA